MIVSKTEGTQQPKGLRSDATMMTPAGQNGAMPQEDTMDTMNVTKATEIAKAVSSNKDLSSDVRKVARKFLRESKTRREAILSRWVPEMCEALGIKDLADHAKPSRPVGKKAIKKAAKKEKNPTAKQIKNALAPRRKKEEPAPVAEEPAPVAKEEPKPKPSVHAPARIANVAEAISQSEGRHLGDLCGWSLSGSRTQADVLAAAEKFGILDDLAFPRTTPNSCYRKAVGIVFSVGKRDKQRQMAYIVEDSSDKLVHAIVTSKVIDDTSSDEESVSAKDAEFTTEIKVGFDKRAYRDGSSAEGCLVSEDPDHPASVELKAKYLELAETYLAGDIRTAFQNAFKTWDACPVLPHGGLWYIPANHAEKVRAWHGFMVELGMSTVVIPTFDTAETIESLRAATRDSLDAQLAEMEWQLDCYVKDGWNKIRDASLERRMREFDELRARAELYQAILGTTIDDLHSKVQACEDRVVKDLDRREIEKTKEEAEKAEADEKKAEEKAAAKAAKEEEKAKEREQRVAERKAAREAAKAAEKPSETRKGRRGSATVAA